MKSSSKSSQFQNKIIFSKMSKEGYLFSCKNNNLQHNLRYFKQHVVATVSGIIMKAAIFRETSRKVWCFHKMLQFSSEERCLRIPIERCLLVSHLFYACNEETEGQAQANKYDRTTIMQVQTQVLLTAFVSYINIAMTTASK